MSQPQEYHHYDYSSKDYQVAPMSSQEQQQSTGDSPFQVDPAYLISPPPVSAPPPPPPSESDAGSIRSVGLHDDDDDSSSGVPSLLTPPPSVSRIPVLPSSTTREEKYPSSSSSTTSSSYYSSYQNTRAAAVPMITNYGVSPAQTFYPKEPAYSKPHRVAQGDTSIRPNTGQTNDEYGGIGSLREVTARLRWMTIACTLIALIWEGFAFPARLLLHAWDHPAKVVLGGYLAFFSLLLLGVELNAPLRDLFGVLYHPLGRGFLLILMSSMCYGIHIDWWELILCMAFAGCSAGYIYAFVKYPEYRRWQDYHDNQIWFDMRHAVQRRVPGQAAEGSAAHWADPSERTSNRTWRDTQRETQSLLHQV